MQSKQAIQEREAGLHGDAIPGMDFMMHRYESELKKPIRNLVNGQLARSLLIQVQSPAWVACWHACLVTGATTALLSATRGSVARSMFLVGSRAADINPLLWACTGDVPAVCLCGAEQIHAISVEQGIRAAVLC